MLPPIPVKKYRATTAGAVPTVAQLQDRIVGFNLKDNLMYWLDMSGGTPLVRSMKLTDVDLAAMALRSDADQSSWTAAQRAQALRNLRRLPSYVTAAWTVGLDDIGRLFVYEATANVACTLPALSDAKDGFHFELETLNLNGQGGVVTFVPAGSDRIEGIAGTFAIPTGQSVRIVADTGSARGWRVLGLRRFNFLQQNVLSAPAAAMVLFLPPGYRRYQIKGDSFVNTTGTAVDLWVKMSNDFGNTYQSTYWYGGDASTSNGAAQNSLASTSAAGLRVMVSLNHATAPGAFNADLMPGSASIRPQVIVHGGHSNATPTPAGSFFSGWCPVAGFGGVNALQFSWDSGGNIPAGAALQAFGIM